MFLLRAEAEVRHTEDLKKVVKSITNFFSIKHYVVREEGPYPTVVAESDRVESLLKFHDILRRERILDSARKVLEHGRRDNTIVFKLHKQSAYAGHPSFVSVDSESPLGPIKVRILTDGPDELIDWLAPKTSGGRPLWDKPIPDL